MKKTAGMVLLLTAGLMSLQVSIAALETAAFERDVCALLEMDTTSGYLEALKLLEERGGYPVQKIEYGASDAICEYHGSQETMRRSSGKVTVYGGFTDFQSTPGRTSVKLIAAFEWEGRYQNQAITSAQDVFSVAWNLPFFADASSQKGSVTYKYFKTGDTIQEVAYTPETNGLGGLELHFDQSKMAYVGSTPVNYLVDSGSVVCDLDTYTEEFQIVGTAKYGKTVGRHVKDVGETMFSVRNQKLAD